ncbi:AEC family transporter [Agrococcus sp. ARC_14]|uniref:AEC family transporter n=1 Tax=Agrococcus sp. ARC_14 TaxID=2919927 RepID=UPI001F05E57D|nr:AEC family transporter [Agrococcus sp. ARC_14]MCH1881981.1 AEC family transporter [Agrococcus sp. ARC_14]
MGGVLIGFAIIGFVILVGWLLARFGIVSQEGRLVLNQTSFFAASPALLFTVLAKADVGLLFSSVLAVALITFAIVAVIYGVVARIWFTKDPSRIALAATASGYSNVNNIGLPVAIYVIGDASFIGPMLLLQLLILAPLLLATLDILTAGRASFVGILTQPLRNPMLIGAMLGAVVAAFDIQLPDPVLAPLEILGGAAVPLMLLAFGISLGGDKPLQPGTGRREVVLAVALKNLVMPVAAFLLAKFAFGMDDHLVYACTVMAALPSAQNMYQYALRYDRATVITRDIVLLTTVMALPVMLVIAWLLKPA